MKTEGYVYVLRNEAMEGIYKIGKTVNLKQRIYTLSNHTGVAMPFELEFAVKVNDATKVERLMHEAFEGYKMPHPNPKKKEFFKVPVKRVISALKLTEGKEITEGSEEWINETVEVINNKELEKEDANLQLERLEPQQEFKIKEEGARKSPVRLLSELKLKVGAELKFVKDKTITCKVVNERQVEYEGEVTSLSAIAIKLLQKNYNWKAQNVSGPWCFLYNDEIYGEEILAERRQRLEEERAQI